ncbi:MAG: HIT family protein [Candidatus Daviesbacteria bacterium]|nr:HIT family protein [Candidatus Daviesbacteria bacterium]
MNNCIFCKIVNNQIPANKIWEDENFLAFLSIEPINPGHTLIIPKKHIDYIFDMDDEDLGELFITCKPIAQALEKAFKPASGKIGIMVAGLEVPHVHVSLIPINSEGDLTFSRAKKADFDKLQEDAEKIKAALK